MLFDGYVDDMTLSWFCTVTKLNVLALLTIMSPEKRRKKGKSIKIQISALKKIKFHSLTIYERHKSLKNNLEAIFISLAQKRENL